MGEVRRLETSDYQDAFALLAEMTHNFAGALDLQATFESALASIARHVGAAAGSLWLVEPGGQEMACVACVGPNPITGLRLPVSEGIVGKSVRENVCQSVLDVSQDPNFSHKMDEQSGFVTRSILCAPMSFSDQVLGAVELINKSTGDARFHSADAHLLQVLASSAGLAIANARLHAAKVENERVRRELELAAEIQRSLLPAPRGADFPAHGVNVPARMVSGDFFDFLQVSSDRLAFCLGDVSGKGMNAALLMAKTASLYRLLAKEELGNPGAVLGRLNEEICETATRGMFVTMAAGVYDCREGSVCIANAGHEPPLYHAPDGRFQSHPAQAPPLGIVEGSEFPEVAFAMRGGSLYLCSDGLTEAPCAGVPMGQKGLQELIARFAAKPLGERIEAIVAAVEECELHDDLTLLGVSDELRTAR